MLPTDFPEEESRRIAQQRAPLRRFSPHTVTKKARQPHGNKVAARDGSIGVDADIGVREPVRNAVRRRFK